MNINKLHFLRELKTKKLFNSILKRGLIAKIAIIAVGLLSTLWFLIRVIPKPSRLSYPCMRATAPLASGFITYILGITGSVLLLKKAWKSILRNKIFHSIVLIFIVAVFLIVSILKNQNYSYAVPVSKNADDHLAPNQPIGEAKGISPGLVVWVHEPTATNPNCSPSEDGNAYYEEHNTIQVKVDSMLSLGLRELTGELTDEAAWDAIFKYHNQQVGKGEAGYADDEIIFIKINRTSAWGEPGWGNINLTDFNRVVNNYYGLCETSPQVIQAVLNQLVNKAGVPQNKIYIGDPMKHIYQKDFVKWHNSFPDVHYLDNEYTFDGREVAKKNTSAKIKYSDKGTVISTTSDSLYSIYDQADYLLNLPTMKGHKHAGVTMFAKNHFGSHTKPGAQHLHAGLVHTEEFGGVYRTDYGMYRVLVDLMGHELLGKKNLVYIMDALFTSNHELGRAMKWELSPFNNHWTSSLFVSFDPVAIESVGFDFLYAEFDNSTDFPQMGAVDDYLEQAADSTKWPAGIKYDPEGDGTNLTSLGVHEHWDSKETKQYSRNLGAEGEGIELRYVKLGDTTTDEPTDIYFTEAGLYKVYPNPFANSLNFEVPDNSDEVYSLSVFDMSGKLRYTANFTGTHTWNTIDNKGNTIEPGQYIYRIAQNGKILSSGKVICNSLR